MPGPDRRREIARALARSAVAGADPAAAVLADWESSSKVPANLVLAFGKASLSMLRAFLSIDESQRGRLERGLCVGLDAEVLDLDPAVEYIRSSHPLPSSQSLLAGEKALSLATRANERDHIMVLVSGGGSAMLESLTEGVSLADLIEATRASFRDGSDIASLNRVRTKFSRIKGGGLARACLPARVTNLIASDVPGDRLEVVASGPTVLAHPRIESRLIVDATMARRAVVREGQALGLRILEMPGHSGGEARITGRDFCVRAEATCAREGADGVVWGGETTVTVANTSGRGGRNQEFVLGAADVIGGALVLSLATDGVDGPSGSAGGFLDAAALAEATETLRREALTKNNAAAVFDRTGTALLLGGPTGTNVADIHLYLT